MLTKRYKPLALAALTVGCVSSLGLVGCGAGSGPADAEPVAPVVEVAEDDREMAAAIATAQQSLGFFEKIWETMETDGYSLKFAMPTAAGGVEHIWFTPTKIDGDRFTGECANHPVDIPGLQVGDERTVPRDQVSDWMILIGGKCYGGYTIRVLAARNPDQAPPLEFVDPPEE